MGKRQIAAAVVVCALTAAAQAALIFSSVTLDGSLAPVSAYVTDDYAVDVLSEAFVDAEAGRASGDLNITFEAEAEPGLVIDRMSLSVLGALFGDAAIEVTELTIRDADTTDLLASYTAMASSNEELPIVASIGFAPRERIAVDTTVVLTANASEAFDLASIGIVGQSFHQIPEPAGLVLLGGGLVVLLRRRVLRRAG